ncbi:MAG: hypothetical protein H8E85_06620 [Candidatus Marinimicrobia bacterium]|nr:hypothetical protein [Candidatus Neomarinimicrobiota bacterium]
MKRVFLLLSISGIFTSCDILNPPEGCTNNMASNYDQDAGVDDGSCNVPTCPDINGSYYGQNCFNSCRVWQVDCYHIGSDMHCEHISHCYTDVVTMYTLNHTFHSEGECEELEPIIEANYWEYTNVWWSDYENCEMICEEELKCGILDGTELSTGVCLDEDGTTRHKYCTIH